MVRVKMFIFIDEYVLSMYWVVCKFLLLHPEELGVFEGVINHLENLPQETFDDNYHKRHYFKYFEYNQVYNQIVNNPVTKMKFENFIKLKSIYGHKPTPIFANLMMILGSIRDNKFVYTSNLEKYIIGLIVSPQLHDKFISEREFMEQLQDDERPIEITVANPIMMSKIRWLFNKPNVKFYIPDHNHSYLDGATKPPRHFVANPMPY